jgi:formamidopyrimidine-DNA glycosylase
MPEYPDITVYIEALQRHALDRVLTRLTVTTPFLIRTYDPPAESLSRQTLVALRRIGKRIAFGFSNGHWLVLHLMVAGRLHWNSKRRALASFEFENGVLTLTEAGSKRQAAIHIFASEAGLETVDAGGLDVLNASFLAFQTRILRANHTLKRALTDPHILSGIGNAYSDEILHHACLSPVQLTSRLSEEELARLYASIRDRLQYFTEVIRTQTGAGFPESVTAFRPEMAVHGKYQQPCSRCGSAVQRIVHATNETNYCPACQTGGRLLADRALSRLLGKDWPRTPEEMELRKRNL